MFHLAEKHIIPWIKDNRGSHPRFYCSNCDWMREKINYKNMYCPKCGYYLSGVVNEWKNEWVYEDIHDEYGTRLKTEEYLNLKGG